MEKRSTSPRRNSERSHSFSTCERSGTTSVLSMSNVVQNYFTGSYKEMVSFFVRDRKLSKSDLQDLMDQIEKEE
ncbi:MAG: BlaI/MecI/CopY family transcriptional regulator [Parabacteroides merdae]